MFAQVKVLGFGFSVWGATFLFSGFKVQGVGAPCHFEEIRV